jgi:hypothetical protein
VEAEWTQCSRPGHPGAGLVEVGHRRGRQPLANHLGEPVQPGRALGEDCGQGAAGQRRAEHVGQQLRGPVHRQVRCTHR